MTPSMLTTRGSASRLRRCALVFAVSLCCCDRYAAATAFTQECNLLVNGVAKEAHLVCRRVAGAPACNLTAFYHQTSGYVFAAPAHGGLSVARGPAPSSALEAPAAPCDKGQPCSWRQGQALLHLQGSPGCNVLFTTLLMHHVELPESYSAVLVLGGRFHAAIKDGTISQNRAPSMVSLLAGIHLDVQGLTISNNSVHAGVFNGVGGSFLNITNTTGSNNHADECGAVAALLRSEAHVFNSTFTHNTAKAGGVLCSRSSGLSLTDVKFLANHADFAGAVFVSKGSARVVTSNFSKNTARVGGGALVLVGTGGSITEAGFNNNTARVAGAVMVINSTASVSSSSFLNNQARIPVCPALPVNKNDPTGMGGALFVRDSNITLQGISLSRNKATSYGGALAIYNDRSPGHAVVNSSTVTGNYARILGGGIHLGTKDDTKASLQRIIHYYQTNSPALLLSHTLLDSNRAGASGGAIVIHTGAFSNIVNSTISNCSAPISGSGLSTTIGRHASRWTDLYMKTLLVIEAEFIDNTGAATGSTVSIGPMFNVTFPNKAWVNQSSPGVDWRKTICGMGEYNAGSTKHRVGFCEPCAAYTFSLDTSHKFKPACEPAPNNTYAPGGAVLVPFAGYWHGTLQELRDQQESGHAQAYKLKDIKRCPHPAACLHDPVALAAQYPYNTTTPHPLSWRDYEMKLCNTQHGYTGPFCGICVAGYGATSPFICQQCLGATFDRTGIAPVMTSPPTRAGISLMWVLYWAVLTLVYLYSTWSALPSRNASVLAPTTASGYRSDTGAADNGSTACEVQGAPAGDGGEPAQPRSNGEAAHVATSPLDIIKALTVYYGWVKLVLALPISWLPPPFSNQLGTGAAAPATYTSSTASSWTQAQAALEWVVTVVLGGPSSLSCLFQAWGLWHSSSATTNSRPSEEWRMAAPVLAAAFIRSVVIPLVFICTATLVQLTWYKVCALPAAPMWLRTPVLKVLPQQSCILPQTQPSKGPTTVTTEQQRSRGSGASWSGASPFTSYLRVHLLASALVVYYASYDTLAKTALSLLWCVDLGGSAGDARWVLDVRLSCPVAMKDWWQAGWAAGAYMLGMFLLLVVCISLPIFFGITLLHKAWHQGTPGQPHTNHPAGIRAQAGHIAHAFEDHVTAGLAYRYSDYAVEAAALTASSWKRAAEHFRTLLPHLRLAAVLCWDSILDLHRFLLAVASMSVMLNKMHQQLLIIVVLGGYLVLILVVRPWKSVATTQLQACGLLVVLTSCCSIMAWDVKVDGDPYGNDSYRQILPWVVLALNACYLVAALGALGWCTVKAVKDRDSKGRLSCTLIRMPS